MEFHPIVIGRSALTEDNADDQHLVDLIEQNTEPFADYYFGALDNHRIRCSNSVREIPPCLVERLDQPAWHQERFIVPAIAEFRCELIAECV